MALDPEFEEAIRTVIKNEFHDLRLSFTIPSQQHYDEHCWMREFKETYTSAGVTIRNVTLGVIVAGILSLIALGFWTKGHP